MIHVVKFISSLDSLNAHNARDGEIYILPNGEAYRYGATGELGNGGGGILQSIGNILQQNAGQIIQTGVAVGMAYLNRPRTQAKGLAAITAFCNQVSGALDALAQQIGSVPPDQINTEANRLVALLSDSGAVYQAKNGEDARVLREAKASAANKAAQIQAATTQMQTALVVPTQTTQPGTTTIPTATQPGVTQPGTTQPGTTQPAASSGFVLDSQTLLLIAGGIGIVWLLKK